MIDNLVRDLQVLRKADFLIARIWLDVLTRRFGLFAFAALIAVFALGMANVAGFYALQGSVGPVWAAAIVAAVDLVNRKGKKLDEVPKLNPAADNPEPLVSLARSTARKREKIDAALALVLGLRLDASADRSEIVSGESFTVRVIPYHREEVAGDFQKPALQLPREWSVVKEEPESGNAVQFTVQAGPKPQSAGNGEERGMRGFRGSARTLAACHL